MDEITNTRTVMFVGDYFTLVTTVVLDEKLREEGEEDNDFALRVASIFMKEYYGFDVEAVSNSIGIVDEEGEVIEDE
jgi:hypothetical protein